MHDTIQMDSNSIFNLIKESETLNIEDSNTVFSYYRNTNEKEKKKIEKLLLEKNEGLIKKTVRRFKYSLNIEEEDLMQEALLAFCKAVHSFEPGHGIKFSSYACKGMTFQLRRYLQKYTTSVTVPVDVYNTYIKLCAMKDAYMEIHNNATFDEFLAYASGKTGIEKKEIESILCDPALDPVISLSSPVSDSSNASEFGDTIPNRYGEVPFLEIENAMYNDSLKELLRTVLTELEYTAIDCLYGLNGQKPKTKKETAATVRMSESTFLRQHKKILKKIRDVLEEIA